MKTKLILLFLIIGMIMLVGCTENVYYTTPSPQQNEPSNQEATPSYDTPRTNNNPQPLTDDRAIFKQWVEMHKTEGRTPSTENEINEILGFLGNWKIEITEIYRGSLIMYGRDYGYLHLYELEDNLRTPPRPMTDEYLLTTVRKHNGEIVIIGSTNSGEYAASFQTQNDLKSFLNEFWGLNT